MNPKQVVAAQGLTKTYRKGDEEIRPVNNLNMSVDEGELVAVMGPSGSGKSTLLHILGGLDKPDSGTCKIENVEITRLNESKLCSFRASNIGFIFQVFNLVPVLSARDNVELPLRLLNLSKERRRKQVETALEIVGLSDRAGHLPSQLSGGQEQRVAIARALATDPKIIIADEPTGNLDEKSGEQVVDVLRRLTSEFNKTIILVTHDSEIAQHADRTLYLRHGQLFDDAVPA